MKFEPAITPYLRPANGVAAMMRQVLFALVPAALASVWFFGIGLIANLFVCIAVCVASEAVAVHLRGRSVEDALSDYSALVTAVLLAFALPPLTPWWISATASVFAIGVAKHVYGGLGFNLFNPAMVGYVVVLVSFPREMSAFIPPRMGDLDYQALKLGESVWYVLSGQLPAGTSLDAITRATPLDAVRSALAQSQTMAEAKASPMFGDFGGRGWEWINNFIALGGAWLLYQRIIRWHIPVGVFAGLLIPAVVA
ncbi:MAG: RnfABCDGE type electron transport complex subunit D, partial [Pseudomonadota bacterium]